MSHTSLQSYRRKQRKKKVQRALILTVVLVVAAVLVIVAYTGLGNSNSDQVGKSFSTSDYSHLAALATGDYGKSDTSLLSDVKNYNGAPLSQSGLPIVVYIGADYCPYCAFQRWPLTIALLRFGAFQNLAYMLSSSSDIYPSSTTLSYYGSSYQSSYLVFQSFEIQDRAGNPLQTFPSQYQSAFQWAGGSYPFINVANKYVLSGAFYNPTLLQARNWTQVIGDIGATTTLRDQVMASANVITAAICKLTGGAPTSVCSNPAITNLLSNPPFMYTLQSVSSASLTIGIPSNAPSMWAAVQYKQTVWRTRSSI